MIFHRLVPALSSSVLSTSEKTSINPARTMYGLLHCHMWIVTLSHVDCYTFTYVLLHLHTRTVTPSHAYSETCEIQYSTCNSPIRRRQTQTQYYPLPIQAPVHYILSRPKPSKNSSNSSFFEQNAYLCDYETGKRNKQPHSSSPTATTFATHGV